MDIIEAILLGIFQGLTEFLPISSSGHLEILNVFLGTSFENALHLNIVVHLATALSTLIVFGKYVREILGSVFTFKWDEASRFAVKILVSNIPLALVGIYYRDQVFLMLESQAFITGIMFLINGLFLFAASRWHRPSTKNIGYLYAFLIGVAQVCALIPGISRSGLTLAIALMLGVKKKEAIVFTFLMITAPIVFSSSVELYTYFNTPPTLQTLSFEPMLASFIAALVIGILFCNLMVGLLEKYGVGIFSYYCWVFGILVISYSLFVSGLTFKDSYLMPLRTIYEQSKPASLPDTLPSIEVAPGTASTVKASLADGMNQLADRGKLTPYDKARVETKILRFFDSPGRQVEVIFAETGERTRYRIDKYLERLWILGRYRVEIVELTMASETQVSTLVILESER